MATVGLFAGGALFGACHAQPTASPPKEAADVSVASVTAQARARGFDPLQVQRGGELYRQHCAVCHGERAEGAPNWHQRGPDGRFPPPPLDGTGHAWHHPQAALVRTIRDGTLKLGGSMPAWGDRLSEADIEAIIAWFQMLWPQELYRNWQELDAQARHRGGHTSSAPGLDSSR